MSQYSLSLIRPNMGNYRSSDALPPLSMGILAARTPKDFDIQFFDDRIETLPADDCPDIAAISVETFTARRAYEIADSYRARGVPVIMGGYHPTFLPHEAAQHSDAVVTGDAEGAWEQALADWRIGGLKPRYQGGVDWPLDDFRLDRSIFTDKHYAPVVPVQYGRGCRFVCDFCSIHAFYGKSLRFRDPEQVALELKNMSPRQLVFFVDDNLFGTPEQLNSLLNAIEPLGLRWSCQISIDVARDTHLLDRMAQAGCVFALLGFESLEPANLKQMAKPWNRVAGEYRDVVRRFHERGIAVYGTFVFGYDGDTLDTIRRTLEFALEARLEIANFNPLTPTPGSALYERLAQEDRLISPRWWLDPDYHYGDPIFRPLNMDPEAFAEACFEAKKDFYSLRSIVSRVLGTDSGLDWFRTGVVALANLISRREIRRKQSRVLGS